MIRFINRYAFIVFALFLGACEENQTNDSEQPTLNAMTLGDPKAPVKIIEYASMTCGYCAEFHLQTLPKLKKDFIAKGIVYLEFREFPLDPWAAAASLTARCVAGKSEQRFFAFLEVLFKKQLQWMNTEDRLLALQSLAQQAGLSQKKFRACLENQKLLQGLNQNKQRGEKAGVNSTPSFFINGTLMKGNQPYELLSEIIEGER